MARTVLPSKVTSRAIIGSILRTSPRTAAMVAQIAAIVAADGLSTIDGATFGLFPDVAVADTVSVGAGGTDVTSTDAVWTADDVGNAIHLAGAGAAGGTHASVITGYTSPTAITIRDAAVTAVAAGVATAGGLAAWGHPPAFELIPDVQTTSAGRLRYRGRVLPAPTREDGDRLAAPISVLDFGAVGDGVADDTVAIQAALTAAAGAVDLPAGRYLVSQALTVSRDGVFLRGAGMGVTVLVASVADQDVITLGDGAALRSFVGVSDLSIETDIAKTAGAAITLDRVALAQVSRVRVDGHFVGVNITQSQLVVLQDCHLINAVAATGCAIKASGGGSNLVLRNVAIDAPVGSQPRCGISLGDWDGVFIESGTQCNHAGDGLLIEPGNGETFQHLFASNASFDSCSGCGCKSAPTGTGVVQRLTFDTCWFGTNDNSGCQLGGGVLGARFVNCQAVNNAGHGIYAASITGLTIEASVIAGNSRAAAGVNDGVFIDANLSQITIAGCFIGVGYGFANTQQYGVQIAAGAGDATVIAGNMFAGDVTAPVANAATGSVIMRDNQGWKTDNTGTATVPAAAGAVGVNHGLAITPAIAAISITPIGNIGAAVKFWVSNVTATGFDINVDAAPGGAGADFAWAVRV